MNLIVCGDQIIFQVTRTFEMGRNERKICTLCTGIYYQIGLIHSFNDSRKFYFRYIISSLNSAVLHVETASIEKGLAEGQVCAAEIYYLIRDPYF